ncbi:hypothetical protein ACJDU8_17755 [Clostridium sp. WILCCON 0269]|uniref:Phage gp6-like head-tail connector protein n=1 Tax=Candidatus Clostridium eludens TaxID=3381663 RepID=A0ABW8SMV8_9CLOT
MFTFENAISDVLNRIEEDPIDEVEEDILQVVKTGINEGYMLIASKLDKRTKDVSFDYVEGYVLPNDFVEEVEVSHNTIGRLSVLDYEIIANLLYIRSKDAHNETLTLKYVNYPVRLVDDTDVINLKDSYYYALLVYGSYTYYAYRRKPDIAAMLLSEFNMLTGGVKDET